MMLCREGFPDEGPTLLAELPLSVVQEIDKLEEWIRLHHLQQPESSEHSRFSSVHDRREYGV